MSEGNFTRLDIRYNQTSHQLDINVTNSTSNGIVGDYDQMYLRATSDYLITVCADCRNGTGGYELFSKNFTSLYSRTMMASWPFDVTYIEQPNIGRLAAFIASRSRIDLLQV